MAAKSMIVRVFAAAQGRAGVQGCGHQDSPGVRSHLWPSGPRRLRSPWFGPFAAVSGGHAGGGCGHPVRLSPPHDVGQLLPRSRAAPHLLVIDLWRRTLGTRRTRGTRGTRCTRSPRRTRGTRRVTKRQNGSVALRWAATAFVDTEKSGRRIIGGDQLRILEAHLDDPDAAAETQKAGRLMRTPGRSASPPPTESGMPSAGEATFHHSDETHLPRDERAETDAPRGDGIHWNRVIPLVALGVSTVLDNNVQLDRRTVAVDIETLDEDSWERGEAPVRVARGKLRSGSHGGGSDPGRTGKAAVAGACRLSRSRQESRPDLPEL